MTRLRTEADVESSARVLGHLLPSGRLLRPVPGSNLERLLEALAAAFADVELRVLDLVDEADPRSTFELVGEWERALGLPGECLPAPLLNLSLRRVAILARLRRSVEQSSSDFVALALSLGFEVELFEPRPFRCGISACGDGLWGEESVWTFYVHAPAASPFYADAGDAVCGQRITDWSNELLECELASWRPAHTRSFVVYDLAPSAPGPWSELYPPPHELVFDVPPGLVVIFGSL